MTDLVAVVTDRGPLRGVISYALREARDAEDPTPTTVRFLIPLGRGGDAIPRATGDALVERVAELAAANRYESLAFAPASFAR